MAVVEQKTEKDVSADEIVKQAKKEKTTKKSAKGGSASGGKTTAVKNADAAWAVLLEPWITEKSHGAMSENRYTFKVVRGSGKKDVKKAVEGLYGVNVEKVAVINVGAKRKNFGRHTGMQSAIKKAVVTIKEGQSIELFKGA